ncbi:hypothetical protein N0V93_004138 [Gnomoniopsis smithogilvyi]|uniref:DUF202 domain-containing protein n=1 Tax=Gnomoniopsis smithogilvyi TaxID=1191159 RepID=A0A9W9CVK5_9PEZI|nr:hypothetical protein N0V93_004138 [Gnomoniopsis smithogilvyi]
MSASGIRDEEDGSLHAVSCCTPLGGICKPVEVEEFFNLGYYDDDTSRLFPCTSPFFIWPFFGPLLFENQTSDARDHCANERTFLSYLRLSIYMAIVSVAIVLSFHVKNQPSAAELAMARPLGVLFWLLSVACLLVGLGNYIETVNKYSRKAAIVQSGFKTQVTMGFVSVAIIATCVTLLVINRLNENTDTK